jgi:capsular polysaccharide biosynthesis protein
MTVNTTQPERLTGSWTDEQEIDLRQYLNVLMQWRLEIGLLIVLAVVLTVAGIWLFQVLQDPLYTSSAEIAIVRTVSDVQFDERFRTESSEPNVLNLNARRLALVALAESAAIAQEVIDTLGPILSEDERLVDGLLDAVEAEVSSPAAVRSNDSDMIRISVKADSPEKAAAIANAWASAFVRKANTTFGQVPDELFNSVQEELVWAEEQYATAQSNLVTFVATSRSDELNRLVLEKQTQIDTISAIETANRMAALDADQKGRRETVEAYIKAMHGVRKTVFEEQVARDQENLRISYSNWVTATHALENARALRTQVEQGGDGSAASSALAVQLLKINVYSGLPEQFQLQLTQPPAVTAEGLIADLDGLIISLEAHQTQLQTQVDDLAAAMLSGNNYIGLGEEMPDGSILAQTVQQELPALYSFSSLSRESETLATAVSQANSPTLDSTAGRLSHLQAEIRQLKGQAEADTSRLLYLTQKRDLTRDTLKALDTKVAELAVVRAASNSEVRMAATAVPPSKPEKGISKLLAAGIAAVVGLVLAIFIALLADYMDQPPFLARSRRQTPEAAGR